MEMQDSESFCGMSENFYDSLIPTMEKFNILFELEDAYEDQGPIIKIAARLLHEVDEVYINSALEFLSGEDVDRAIKEWMKLKAISKLELVKTIHRKSYR